MKTRLWVLSAMALICSVTLLVFLLRTVGTGAAEPLHLTENDLRPATVVQLAATEPLPTAAQPATPAPQPATPEGEAFLGLPPIGQYRTAIEKADPAIVAALQSGGLALQCNTPLPDAPNSVPKYCYKMLTLERTELLPLLFGEDYAFRYDSDAIGINGTLTTGNGTYHVLLDGETRCYIHLEDGEPCRSADTLASLPGEIAEQLGIDLAFWRTGYDCGFGMARSDYVQLLGDIPITDHWRADGVDESANGAVFNVRYDDNGLRELELSSLAKAEPTGEVYQGLLSAADALQAVRARMSSTSSVNTVQNITECRLVYLPPFSQGDVLLPAWELRFDLYTLDRSGRFLDVNCGEYAYLVNALDGTVYTYH